MLVRAAITAAFQGTAYSTRNIYSVEEFFIDSAMDTDTDTWQISLGDTDHNLIALLKRDSEVRASVYIEGEGNISPLNTGIADEIAWNDEGSMVINGRDFTSIAVDSVHPPQRYQQARSHVVVGNEARAIGVGHTLKLAKTSPNFKQLATDGSESYWQFWYRLYRKRRMWLWAEADGTLVGGKLNYNQQPSYYFGDAQGLSSKYNKINFIPVESMEWRANKQQRVAIVYVIGNRGDKTSFVAKAVDPTMNHWVKRPISIVTSKSAHGPGEARAEAWEEIFESKVGASEITITVANPNVVIRQDRVCFLNIVSANVRGEFYVVGSKIIGDISSGFFQQVRLREKSYAISRRVPTDPSFAAGPGDTAMFGPPGLGGFGPRNPAGTITAATSDVIESVSGNAQNWGEYFVSATDKNRGPWPFALFLGTILAICKHETNFRNIRYGGSSGPDYPGNPSGHIPSIMTETAAFNRFVDRYANDPKYGRIAAPPGFTQWAVGPMQLYTPAYKEYADRAAGTPIDELIGGRWQPRYNILAGAYALRSKLHGLEAVLDPNNPAQAYSLIWQGVAAYGGADHYGAEIKAIYDESFAQPIVDATKAASASTKDNASVGWTFEFARQATGGIGTNLGGPAAHQAKHDSGENWQSNNAYDIGVPIGTSIYSLSAGTVGPNIGVQSARPKDGMRLTVGQYWYAHLSSIAVYAGQNVKKGQLLGKSGASQNGAAHLHVSFEGGV